MPFLHQVVNMVANPLGITLGFVILGSMMLRKGARGRKWGWRVICAGVVVTVLMGLNPVCEVMAWWLEKDYSPVRAEELPLANAIVVLGGGVAGVPEGSSAPYPNLQDSADRVWHAARIWHSRAVPKNNMGVTNSTVHLFSPPPPNLKIYCTCPDVSRSTPPFLRDLGVNGDCIVPLDGPWNTEAEAREIEKVMQKLVEDKKLNVDVGERNHHSPTPTTNSNNRVYLVTSAAHMKRAVRIFRRYAPGVEVVPAATDHIVVDNPRREISWQYFVPNMGAYCRFNVLLHEYLGLIRYW